MSTEDGWFAEEAAGPVRVADFDALDEPGERDESDESDAAAPAVRVASFDLDDLDDVDDAEAEDAGAVGGVGGVGGRDRGSGVDAAEGPGDRVGLAGAPTAGIRPVDLDAGVDADEPPRTRVVSFDEPLDDGPDVATRRARFDGTLPAERRESRDRRSRGRGSRDSGSRAGAGGRDSGSRDGAGGRDAGTRPRRGRGGRRSGDGGDGSGADGVGTARGRAGRKGAGDRAAAGPPPDDESRAKEICLCLLTDRARTVKELRDALVRKEIPDDVADRVLERFDEVGLVDDEAFAGQWVRSRHRHRGLGRRAIAQELHRKGVAKEIADEALTEIDAESEQARARELVDKKMRTVKVGTREERAAASRRLVGMLARKGYGAGVAYSVVREAIAARGADEDELGEEPAED